MKRRAGILPLFVSTIIISISASAFAGGHYTCVDSQKNVAELVITDKNHVQWVEPWHTSESRGVLVKKETAPYSDVKGYRVYKLIDFLMNDYSGYYLALSSTSGSEISAKVYFDNDDHNEEESYFRCSK